MRIRLDNVQQCYTYRLVQLRGSIQCFNAALRRPREIKLIDGKSECPTVWPVVGDDFKILVHLNDQVNRFKLWIEDEELMNGRVVDSAEVCLRFEEEASDRVVRLVYVTCRDAQDSTRLFEDGRFEAPKEEDASVESACRRIALGALMSQCFFAQSLNRPRTYQLEQNAASTVWPTVHHFTIEQNERQLWQLRPEELWKLIARELMSSPLASRSCKFLAFVGFSRYQVNAEHPVWLPSGQVRSYVSLGGGGLALLSTQCLYTWPESVADIAVRLADDRPVDRSKFMDDSHNRNTRSGCYATTLGASIHELGHTFNLGHSSSGIMERLFNQIDHFFLPLQLEPTAWWTPSEAVILQHHKWLNCHHLAAQSTTGHFSVDPSRRTIHSHLPLTVAEYRCPGTNKVLDCTVFTSKHSNQHRFEVTLPPLCDSCLLFLMDCQGNILQERFTVSQLV